MVWEGCEHALEALPAIGCLLGSSVATPRRVLHERHVIEEVCHLGFVPAQIHAGYSKDLKTVTWPYNRFVWLAQFFQAELSWAELSGAERSGAERSWAGPAWLLLLGVELQ